MQAKIQKEDAAFNVSVPQSPSRTSSKRFSHLDRGDQGFCSEECRRQRIFMDEEGGWREEQYGSLVREVVVPVERSRQEKVEYGGQAEELGSTSCRVK
ncbi:hypothetical protein ZIOFF_004479 [Zingiber officinale]|uniref:FLZ-type domain-containing protein n=1 Tax=Zingiber officinale TaxID=94328 RepID=A0A8J5IQW6_ZINOF|nr:hypothetical protein ZIOFF_004479 [Zingiber officinale]